ncbi:MAG: Apolipoprotein N-acyltransferase [Chlamydiia bacterium]|nr:Apolipoprotein N-acyltransferase [Chlamydiia bacterium]
MKKDRFSFYLLFLSLPILIVHPFSIVGCVVAYFISYPALFLLLFKFEGRKKRGFFLYFFGLVYFLIQMWWMGQAKYHGDMIVLAYVVLSLVFSYPYFVMGYSLPKKEEDLSFRRIFLLALIFSVLEYSRLFILCGFPFHTVGMILTVHKVPLQLVSMIGLYGLTFIVMMWALYAVRFIQQGKTRALSVSFIPILVGLLLINFNKLPVEKVQKLNVALVQTGIKVEERWDISGFDNTYIEEIDQLKIIWNQIKDLKTADLILLPEASLPGDAVEKRFERKSLEALFEEELHPLLHTNKMSYLDVFAMLSIHLDADIMVGLIEANFTSAFYLSRGELVGRYDKQRLVPIGEYLPFEFLRNVASKYGATSFFVPGYKKGIIKGKCNILTSICYDEGFPEDFLSKQKFNPLIHVNLTNDAWFLSSSLLDHHLNQSIVRSVENGMYALRACNTGISAIISPEGEILEAALEKDKTGRINRKVIQRSIDLYRRKPLFSYLGNPGLLLICSVLVLVLFYLARRTEVLKT